MSKNQQAVFHTSVGTITVQLFPEQAPKTVANFVGLATGTKAWKDPATGQMTEGKPLYTGTIFHRVIPKFMLQGGDPLGKGTGGPGYRFEDECDNDLSFDKPGYLAMANAGPNTNGSQFFITVVPCPWLDGKHTIFGVVTAGQDIVDKITKVERDHMDRPRTPITLEKVEIL